MNRTDNGHATIHGESLKVSSTLVAIFNWHFFFSSEYFDQVDGFPRPNIGLVPDLVADFPSLGGTKPTQGPGRLAGPPPKQGFAQVRQLKKKI